MPQWGGGPTCSKCQRVVYATEEKRAIGKVYHAGCFKCADCGKLLESSTCCEHEGDVFCKTCYGRQFGPSGYGFAGGAAGLQGGRGKGTTLGLLSPDEVPGPVDLQHPENCPRCGKKAYFAEAMHVFNRKWHRSCFKCLECKKMLDAQSYCDHSGQVYCKTCYARLFGIKGCGYGIGAGSLTTY